jgi:hypothetical protein
MCFCYAEHEEVGEMDIVYWALDGLRYNSICMHLFLTGIHNGFSGCVHSYPVLPLD